MESLSSTIKARKKGAKPKTPKMKAFNIGDTVHFMENRPDSNKSGSFKSKITSNNHDKLMGDLEGGRIRVLSNYGNPDYKPKKKKPAISQFIGSR